MKVDQIMTQNPVFCARKETVRRAAELMREWDTGIIPIVQDQQSRILVGVLTDRDICLRVVAEGGDLYGLVEDVMTGSPICCRPTDSVERVVDLMQENQVRRIPVVNADREIVGIVSTADIVLASDVSADMVEETMRELSVPPESPAVAGRPQDIAQLASRRTEAALRRRRTRSEQTRTIGHVPPYPLPEPHDPYPDIRGVQ